MGRFIDRTGQRQGHLRVIERAENIGIKVAWFCHCDCGNSSAIIKADSFVNGVQTCGCLNGQPLTMAGHPLAYRYRQMMARCYSPRSNEYPGWGGRGIRVCARWRESFSDYVADIRTLGPLPAPGSRLSLDRIDNNGDYELSNVRWANPSVQSNNRRSTRSFTAFGKTMTLREWSRETGVPYSALYYRIDTGISAEEAFSTPSGGVEARRPNHRMVTALGRTQRLKDWAAEYDISASTLRNRLNEGWHPDDAVTLPKFARNPLRQL